MYARLWATGGQPLARRASVRGWGRGKGLERKHPAQGHLGQCKKLKNSPTGVTGRGGTLHSQVGKT